MPPSKLKCPICKKKLRTSAVADLLVDEKYILICMSESGITDYAHYSYYETTIAQMESFIMYPYAIDTLKDKLGDTYKITKYIKKINLDNDYENSPDEKFYDIKTIHKSFNKLNRTCATKVLNNLLKYNEVEIINKLEKCL